MKVNRFIAVWWCLILSNVVSAETCPTCEQWISDRDWCYEALSWSEDQLVFASGDLSAAERDRDGYDIEIHLSMQDLFSLQRSQMGYQRELVDLWRTPESDRDAEWKQREKWVLLSLSNLMGLIVQTENEIERLEIRLIIACASVESALTDIAKREGTVELAQTAIDDLTDKIDNCAH